MLHNRFFIPNRPPFEPKRLQKLLRPDCLSAIHQKMKWIHNLNCCSLCCSLLRSSRRHPCGRNWMAGNRHTSRFRWTLFRMKTTKATTHFSVPIKWPGRLDWVRSFRWMLKTNRKSRTASHCWTALLCRSRPWNIEAPAVKLWSCKRHQSRPNRKTLWMDTGTDPHAI